MGATRPVVDDGRLPKERLIGQTGRTVAPELYLALGISGSPHHVAGVQGAEHIVAVNKDEHAPIVSFSDTSFIGGSRGRAAGAGAAAQGVDAPRRRGRGRTRCLSFDAIVVGAGPAGRRPRSGHGPAAALRVLLLERGEWPAPRTCSAACSSPARRRSACCPGFWDDAPWERYVVKARADRGRAEVIHLAGARVAGRGGKEPYAGFTLYRPVFDRWYAERARDAGVTLLCSCMVEGLVVREARCAGCASPATRTGVIEAPVVIAADGVVSLLGQGGRAALRHSSPATWPWACALCSGWTRASSTQRLGLRGREARPTSTWAAPRACAAARSSTRNSTA